MVNYKINRFEQTGDSLFICINSPNTYIEHFLTADEQLDPKGTIERLVAELELKEEAYIAPTPTINKIEEAKALVIDPVKVATAKEVIVAEKLQAIEDAKPKEEKPLIVK